jgi:hypothetical protein
VLAATQDSGLVLKERLRLFSKITGRKRKGGRVSLLFTVLLRFVLSIYFFFVCAKIYIGKMFALRMYSESLYASHIIALACISLNLSGYAELFLDKFS